MSRDIPGYYFDAEKKKYFKILPNHIGRGSEYSSEVVKAKSAAEQAESRENAHQGRIRRQRLTCSRLFHHPLLGFSWRLDSRGGRATSDVVDYFCAALTKQNAFQSHRPHHISSDYEATRIGPKFALEDGSGDMFTTAGVPAVTRFLGRFTRCRTAQRHLWKPEGLEIGPLFPLRCEIDLLLIIPSNCVVFSESATRGLSTITAVGMGNLRALAEDGDGVQFAQTSICSYQSNTRAWDMAASPHDPRWAVATDRGVECYDAGSQRKMNALPSLGPWEQMTVNYRDKHIIMAGSRSGHIKFADSRGGNIDRLHHSSAVNAIRTLPDNNYVLVSGLQSMSLYDLRYAAAPTRRQGRKPTSFTSPYISFNITQDRTSDRYGLGFDFDPELGIVASATSRASSHRVSLYSVYTGKLIRESPLNKSFDNPVTCIRIARVRDGPKSILISTGGQIEEWTASGA